jgi:ribosomal protein S18 acetylase RimI-like enzyme
VGLDCLQAVTELLQRVRSAHPTAGLYEAADLQWWWRLPRSTDVLEQLIWFDDEGRPAAASVATAWNDRVAVDPIVMPGSRPDWVVHVVERGLAHAEASGIRDIGLEVGRDDEVLRGVLEGHGFAIEDDGVVEAWLTTHDRPAVSRLHADDRLSTRQATSHRPHHMISEARNHPDPEPRLRQTSLYRPDLDLVVHDRDGNVAAYGLFWYDPVTDTGLVEPMRTEDAHRRRGLARHVLTTGIDLLARAGARRVKICFEPDNAAARDLYLGVGFVPHRQTDLYARHR